VIHESAVRIEANLNNWPSQRASVVPTGGVRAAWISEHLPNLLLRHASLQMLQSSEVKRWLVKLPHHQPDTDRSEKSQSAYYS